MSTINFIHLYGYMSLSLISLALVLSDIVMEQKKNKRLCLFLFHSNDQSTKMLECESKSHWHPPFRHRVFSPFHEGKGGK